MVSFSGYSWQQLDDSSIYTSMSNAAHFMPSDMVHYVHQIENPRILIKPSRDATMLRHESTMQITRNGGTLLSVKVIVSTESSATLYELQASMASHEKHRKQPARKNRSSCPRCIHQMNYTNNSALNYTTESSLSLLRTGRCRLLGCCMFVCDMVSTSTTYSQAPALMRT